MSFSFCKKTRAQEYIFNHLSTRDGLLSNNILSLYQDKKGFLWIGTESGLQRYDGYRFTTVTINGSSEPVNQILEDAAGSMWLRLGKKAGIFDPSRFLFRQVLIEINFEYDQSLFSLNTDGGKNVFVVIRGVTCLYLSKDGKSFKEGNTPFQLPKDWSFDNVLHDSLKKRYWLYGRSGLGYFDMASKRFYSYLNPSQHPLVTNKQLSSDVVNFYIDHQRRHWIEKWNAEKTRNEYYCFDDSKNSFTKDTAGLMASGNGSYYEIHHFTEFNDTTVLVYGLNAMRMLENGYFTDFRSPQYTPYGIQFDVVNAVLEDREHILWVATDDGLYNTMANINNNRHLMIGQDKGRSAINCLMEDEAKNLWIGTWGRGLIILDSALRPNQIIRSAVKEVADNAANMNWALQQHTVTKKIWVGCQDGRLVIFDPKTNNTELLKPSAFENRTVRQIVEDSSSKLWFGLQSGRLFYCNPLDQGIRFHEAAHFANFISKLKFDRKGSLWIAVAGKGIYVMNIKTGTIERTYDLQSPGAWLSSNSVRDILPLNDSICIIAGDNLDILNTYAGKTKTISQYDKAPIGKIFALQPGKSNDCWLSTSNGIYRYTVETGRLIKYSQWDGLITVFSNSFVMETSLQLRNKNLVFGGNQNLVLFDVARYRQTAVPPDVQITGFQLLNTYLPVDSVMSLATLQLNYRQSSFIIEFASLSFIQLEKLTYEYKLKGVDQHWISVNKPQPVKYSLLPAGRYEFMVRVKNSEGVYSKNDTRLLIVIAPPFWKTYWFLALIVLATSGFLYSLHRLRLKRLLHVEKIRSKLARDLHDDMGSTLSTINILSNMALQQPDLDAKINKSFMVKISESTSQMMESMDDIIWSINPLNDSMGKVLARMKQVAGSVLEPQGIEYRFEAEEAVKGLSFTMEWRREIFLIYKEAVNNIVKYAKCTKVDVVLKKEASLFVLIVKDNGIGFDAGIKKEILPTRGNGFVNMRKRAETMQAQLQILSAENNGTQIRLSIPFA